MVTSVLVGGAAGGGGGEDARVTVSPAVPSLQGHHSCEPAHELAEALVGERVDYRVRDRVQEEHLHGDYLEANVHWNL